MTTAPHQTGGRRSTRLVAAAAALALVPLTAAAASAGTTAQDDRGRSWSPMASVHGASTQGCVKAAPGESGAEWKLLVRGDNRNGEHTHLFGVTVYPDSTFTDPISEWDGKARAGRTTKAVKVVVPDADDVLVAGIGEVTGEGLGGDVDLTLLARC